MLRMIAALPVPDGWQIRRGGNLVPTTHPVGTSVGGKAGWRQEANQKGPWRQGFEPMRP